jgi:hypothetical protein
MLGFTPANAVNDGLYRKVDVKVVPSAGRPRLRASWRTGYYAPTGP